MFRLNTISKATLVLCATGLSLAAVAQQQQQPQQGDSAKQQKPAQLERVQVIGSNIKRVNTETVAPVQIVTKEQIVRSGQPTIADVLRSLPANTGGSFGESFTNSFAPGASGISLRGLGQKTTLVLINGRRMAGYGFAQNISDSFVDLNAIPSSAVERVEILKDGASALYGSDAIAGVVNVILRSDFQGAGMAGGMGRYHGKGDLRGNLSAGFGDMGSDKFNVFGVLDVYRRDQLTISDISGDSRDNRDKAGGRNAGLLTQGGTWQAFNNSGVGLPIYRARTECAAWGGTVLTAAEAVQQGLLTSTSTANLPGNTFCRKNDFNSQIVMLPKTQRVGFLSRATAELDATTTLFAELGLSRSVTDQFLTPPLVANTGLVVTSANTLRPFSFNPYMRSGSGGNPFANGHAGASTSLGLARMSGYYDDIGPRSSEITSDATRALVGAKYELMGWEFDSAVGMARSKTASTSRNLLTLSGTAAALGVTTAPVPQVSSASIYNFDSPSLNSQDLLNSMITSTQRKSTSKLAFIDTKATTEFEDLKLPGGNVGMAVGVDFRKESIQDIPDPQLSSGNIMGLGTVRVDGERKSQAYFAELALPVLKNVEMQLAARHDRYSDFGSTTNPKVGVKWTPHSKLAIRANYGKGFRAPTLPEAAQSTATYFTNVQDPQDGVIRGISGSFDGNPNLQPETSTSKTLGLIFEPNRYLSMSIDAYEIDWRNVVDAKSLNQILQEACPEGTYAPGGPLCSNTDPRVVRDPATNVVLSVASQWENLTQRLTSGVDFDVRLRIPTEDFGRFGVRADGVYVREFREEGVNVANSNLGSNTIPKFKGALAVDWDNGPLAVTGRMNFTKGWRQEAVVGSYFVPQDPRFQNGVLPPYTASHTTYDLFGRYRVSPQLSLSTSVTNVMNQRPPYDPAWGTSFYDFSQYSPLGRQVRFGFDYKI